MTAWSFGAWRASTLFAAYEPPEEYRVDNERLPWMLLATPGDGVEAERWVDAVATPVWLDYQLCRHSDAGDLRWTWRRTHEEMSQLYAELGDDLAKGRHGAVTRTLQRIAHQPDFHGVKAQSADLFAFAKGRGYRGEMPTLFYVQKISHGKPLVIA